MEFENLINPFTTMPVEPKFFAGRKAEMARIERQFGILTTGNTAHIFIEGERAIGKSSILKYIQYKISSDSKYENNNILFLYVKLGDCKSTINACGKIVDAFNEKIDWTTRLRDKIKGIRGLEVKVFGTGGRIDIDKTAELDIQTSFSKALYVIVDSLNEKYKFIVLMLDETDAVVENEDFGRLIKNTIEELDINKKKNVMVIMTATPQGRKNCEESHSGFIRSFILIKLKKFKDEEGLELINRALSKGRPKTEFTPEAKEFLIKLSQGTPGMLQELCQVVFERFRGQTVGKKEVLESMVDSEEHVGSLTIIGQKYFSRLEELEKQHSLYKKITQIYSEKPNDSISIKELVEKTGVEEKIIRRIVKHLLKVGVLEKEGITTKYRLSSTLLGAYLYARNQSLIAKGKKY